MARWFRRFVVVAAFLAVGLAAGVAHAGETGDLAERDKYLGLAAGLAIGIAALGGAFGQGRAAAAALTGIARNPSAAGRMFVPLLLGLVLIETLVIYALLIAFDLSGKIGG